MTQIGDCAVVICRELTKVHEELVRGPISAALKVLSLETGELTIVVDIGHKPDISTREPLSDEAMALEIGHMTDQLKISKRNAIQRLARKHGRRPNDVYAAVERARKLVK